MCTAFSAPMMEALAVALDACNDGALLITATVPLPSASWTLLGSHYLPMSWGSTNLHVQRKAPDLPRWSYANEPKVSDLEPVASRHSNASCTAPFCRLQCIYSALLLLLMLLMLHLPMRYLKP
eukprot:SAG11_NODE_1385_length_5070_cov_3.950915_7_plen_123_part_00